MSRLHQAIQRAQGAPETSATGGDTGRHGLEVFSGGRARVQAPWCFDDTPARPVARDVGSRAHLPGRPVAAEEARSLAPEQARPAGPEHLRSPAPAEARRPAPLETAPAVPSTARRRRGFPTRLVVVLVAGAASGAYLAFGTGGPSADGPMRLTGVVVANRVVVSAKASGRIERLAVEESTHVAAGDLVATLDREELDAERQRQLALEEQLSARLRQAHDVVALEQGRGRGGVASAEAQLGVARSQRDEAAAAFEQLLKDAERSRLLSGQGLLPLQEVERVETDVQVAAARVRSLSDHVLRAEADLDLARANEGQVGVAGREVEQIEAQLAQARADLARIDARVSDTEVRAPLAGVVAVRVAREGEVVRAGDPIVTIVDLDDVWIRAELEESDVGRVAVGQTLEVELASGQRVSGRLTFVEPEAQFATQRDVSRVKRDIRTFGIKVVLLEPDRRVHHGMTAYVLIPPPPAPATAR